MKLCCPYMVGSLLQPMSALLQIADLRQRSIEVRGVPKSDVLDYDSSRLSWRYVA